MAGEQFVLCIRSNGNCHIKQAEFCVLNMPQVDILCAVNVDALIFFGSALNYVSN